VFGETVSPPGTVVNTDEWQGYNWLGPSGRERRSVNHTPGAREWARDEDGDGIREVHTNSIEGFWTGLRTFLRPFRGISKWYLSQYVAVYEVVHSFKEITSVLIRAMLIDNATPIL
jgi:hypothetical protein